MHARRSVLVVTLCAAGLGLLPAAAAQATIPSKYSNCTNLRGSYPHGVGRAGARDHVAAGARPVTTWTRSTSAYNTAVHYNASLDRDHDDIACEKA
jgi:hypothetical protein